ncbi:MAG TPA: polymer-forming cytoskeletal protein [Candidatus Binataceae bacterium]
MSDAISKFRAAILASGVAALACCVASCASVQPNVPGVGGTLILDGPLTVQGPLLVGGSAVVHGPVRARELSVGGSVAPTLPRNETPGPAGAVLAGPYRVGGSLIVNGPLLVDGLLKVGGSLVMEPSAIPDVREGSYPVTE